MPEFYGGEYLFYIICIVVVPWGVVYYHAVGVFAVKHDEAPFFAAVIIALCCGISVKVNGLLHKPRAADSEVFAVFYGYGALGFIVGAEICGNAACWLVFCLGGRV